MTTLLIISIILFVAALVLFVLARNWRIENRLERERLDEMNQRLIKREASCREAMKRNGAARLELDKREGAFDLEHKAITVEYEPTEEDRQKYPSDAKLTAVVKSRLAHNLGYRILAEFPGVNRCGDKFRYTFLVKEEK